MKLTTAQIVMLRCAAESRDGSVRACGFHRSVHATGTAKALHARGLVAFFRKSLGVGDIWKITDAGRAALKQLMVDGLTERK